MKHFRIFSRMIRCGLPGSKCEVQDKSIKQCLGIFLGGISISTDMEVSIQFRQSFQVSCYGSCGYCSVWPSESQMSECWVNQGFGSSGNGPKQEKRLI